MTGWLNNCKKKLMNKTKKAGQLLGLIFSFSKVLVIADVKKIVIA